MPEPKPPLSPTPVPPARQVIPPRLGEVITSTATGNSYTMGQKLGEGNFGVVFACVDRWNNELAAKVFKANGPYEKVKAAAEAEFRKLLLLRNPFITFVYDAFEFRDTFYIITERCQPLSALLAWPQFAGNLWVKPIARCLLQAVHYLHVNAYVHQDIHPGNVFTAYVKNEMNPAALKAVQFKLGDLGIARVLGEVEAANTRAQWMLPPEVLAPNEYGPVGTGVDIYHTGLLLLQVAHSRARRFTREEILGGTPRQLAQQLPPPLNVALGKALRRHAEQRTANALDLWRDLNA